MADQIDSTSVEPVEPSPATAPVVAKGTVPTGDKGAETQVKEGDKVVTPTPRTYSEEDWRKRESALDKQLAKLKTESDAERTRLQQAFDAAQSQIEEANNKAFLQRIEDAGGDVNAAKVLIERQTALAKSQRDFEAKRLELQRREMILAEAGKGKQAHDLMTEYNLRKEALDDLLQAESRETMKVKALEMHVNALKTEQRKPTKTDTTTPSTKGVDLSKMPPSLRLGTLMEQAQEK